MTARRLCRLAGGLLCAALVLGCSQRRPPPARMPSVKEATPESVVVNYAPTALRVFPDRGSNGKGRYLLLASERPGLVATWRPLAVVDREPPEGLRARAGDFVWAVDHVIKGEVSGGKAVLKVYDHDGQKAEAVPLELPCEAAPPLLLQAVGGEVHGAVLCAGGGAVVVTADGAGKRTRMVKVADVAQLDLYLRSEAGDYLLGDRKLVRVIEGGRQIIGTVPPPGGGAETRELLFTTDGSQDLLVVDGAIGRVIRMDGTALRWQAEGRFVVGRKVERMRAALSGELLTVVLAERAQSGTDLFGVAVPLKTLSSPPSAPRMILGTGPSPSDHELVPVARGDASALLVRTHQGNTGPLVALSRLKF